MPTTIATATVALSMTRDAGLAYCDYSLNTDAPNFNFEFTTNNQYPYSADGFVEITLDANVFDLAASSDIAVDVSWTYLATPGIGLDSWQTVSPVLIVKVGTDTLRLSKLYRTYITPSPSFAIFDDVVARHTEHKFTVKGLKYKSTVTGTSACTSVTFSVKTRHTQSYEAADYFFDIDDMGSATIAMDSAPAKEDINSITISGGSVTNNRLINYQRANIEIYLAFKMDFVAATDKIKITIPAKNKMYEGLTGVSVNHCFSNSALEWSDSVDGATARKVAPTYTIPADWTNMSVEFTLLSDFTAGKVLNLKSESWGFGLPPASKVDTTLWTFSHTRAGSEIYAWNSKQATTVAGVPNRLTSTEITITVGEYEFALGNLGSEF